MSHVRAWKQQRVDELREFLGQERARTWFVVVFNLREDLGDVPAKLLVLLGQLQRAAKDAQLFLDGRRTGALGEPVVDILRRDEMIVTGEPLWEEARQMSRLRIDHFESAFCTLQSDPARAVFREGVVERGLVRGCVRRIDGFSFEACL